MGEEAVECSTECKGNCNYCHDFGVCATRRLREPVLNPRERLLELHRTTCAAAIKTMEAKNQDYAGDGSDPFANFRACEIFGVPAEIGILTRSIDKFKRIESFVNTGTLAVKSESVDDAIEDVINYMILLKGIIKERQGE